MRRHLPGSGDGLLVVWAAFLFLWIENVVKANVLGFTAPCSNSPLRPVRPSSAWLHDYVIGSVKNDLPRYKNRHRRAGDGFITRQEYLRLTWSPV